MIYQSTRGEAEHAGFAKVLLEGLGRDGGLFVPTSVPPFSVATMSGFVGSRFQDVAQRVIAPFCEEAFAPAVLRRMIASAYDTFNHPAVTPLAQIDAEPLRPRAVPRTHAGVQGRGHATARAHDGRGAPPQRSRATIVGATSGDTGAAAIDAFGASRTSMSSFSIRMAECRGAAAADDGRARRQRAIRWRSRGPLTTVRPS